MPVEANPEPIEIIIAHRRRMEWDLGRLLARQRACVRKESLARASRNESANLQNQRIWQPYRINGSDMPEQFGERIGPCDFECAVVMAVDMFPDVEWIE